jgi:triosephosphate isomerase
MRTPILIVNFKNYPQALGEKGLELAKSLERAAERMKKEVAIAPPTPILMKVAREVTLPVLSQHVDPVPASSTTGYQPVESIKEAGCVGSIINHSEHKIPHEDVEKAINGLRSLNLKSVVCADSVEEGEKLAVFSPDFIAIEPPELIGTGISVSRAKPEVIVGGVKAVKKVNSSIKVLCGAGVSDGNDVKKAVELGAEGVLVASAIVKARDPYQKAVEMLSFL